MTDHIKIHDVLPRVQYISDGLQLEYPFLFPIFAETNLSVLIGDAPASNYAVSGVGDSSGGTVVFAQPPAAGAVITVMRRLPLQRLSDFQEGGTLRAKVINNELDYQTAMIQQIAEDVGRAVKRSPVAAGTVELTLPEPQPGAYLRWSPTSDSLEAVAGEANSSSFTQTGAGAKPQLISAKLSDILSVKDFGAVGDGKADDTDAIQAAIDELERRGGGTVQVPCGIFRITRTLYLGAYMVLAGQGYAPWSQTLTRSAGSTIHADFAANPNQVAIHISPKVKQAKPGQTVGDRFKDGNFTYRVVDSEVTGGAYGLCDGAGVENLTIFTSSNAFCGLRLSAASTGRTRKVAIKGFRYGIIGEANWESSLEKCVVTDFEVAGYAGYSGQHAINFDGCWFHGGSKSSSDNVGIRLEWAAGCTLTAPSLESVATGIVLGIADGITVTGAQCERIGTLVKLYNARGFHWIGGDLYNPSSMTNCVVVNGSAFEAAIDDLRIEHPNYPVGERSFPGKWIGPDVTSSDRLRLPLYVNPDAERRIHDMRWGQGTNNQTFDMGAAKLDRWQRFRASDGTAQINDFFSVNSVTADFFRRLTLREETWCDLASGTAQVVIRPTSSAIELQGVTVRRYWGNPQGWVTANPASLCLDASTGNLYRKASGTGNMGWVQLP